MGTVPADASNFVGLSADRCCGRRHIRRVGVGIIVRQGGSSGGDDALALTISHLTHRRLSLAYLFTDLTVLTLSLTYIPFSVLFIRLSQ